MRKRRFVCRIYGMKYSWKDHKDRNRCKNRKRSEQAVLVYVRKINCNIPTTWGWARGDPSVRTVRFAEILHEQRCVSFCFCFFVQSVEISISKLLMNSFYHHHHHYQSLNCEGRWGTTDDFATSFLHFSLFSTALWDLANSRPVHFLMLSSRLFLSLPCLLPQDGFSQTGILAGDVSKVGGTPQKVSLGTSWQLIQSPGGHFGWWNGPQMGVSSLGGWGGAFKVGANLGYYTGLTVDCLASASPASCK